MKNKLSDLNDHLFSQIERLTKDKMTTQDIAVEVNRATALSKLAN